MKALHDIIVAHWFIVPAILLVVFGTVLVLKELAARTIRADLLRASENLPAWDPSADEEDDDVRGFLRPYLLSVSPVALASWPSPRLVVTRELEDMLDSYVEHRTAKVRFTLGSAATGVALLCTFVLIAIVLTNDINAALKASGDGAEAKLADAVGLLGQKFAISATGIGLAIVFGIVNSTIRKRLLAASHAVCSRAAARFATPASLAATAQLELLQESRQQTDAAADQGKRLEAMNAQLAEMKTVLEATRTDLEKLQSIEVSVQAIGAEVTHQFREMITKDLGEQIKDILREVMVQADAMSNRLRSELIDGFQKTIEQELPKVIGSLDEIKKSVEGQAALPVERMLEQLQGIVSGGFKGESAQMSAAIRQFGEVVPALAEQLRSVASTLTKELGARAEESARTSDTLFRQVSVLLERMEAQQTASERAVAEITRASTAGAESMVQRLESTSNEFVAKLLQSSRSEVEALAARLKDAANASASGYANLEQSVAGASKSILEARDGLAEAAKAMRALAADVRGVTQDAKQSSETARLAANGFENAATQLRTGVVSMQQAIDSARAQATEQRAVLDEHRRVLASLEQVWPKLFETYLKSFEEKSSALNRSWNDLYDRIGKLSGTVSGGLVDAAEDLKTSVDRLASLQGGNGSGRRA